MRPRFRANIYPHDLWRYDTGHYAAEAKIDGIYCEMTIGRSGEPHRLVTRTGNEVADARRGDLHLLRLDVPAGTVLVGELEAGSSWATAQHARLGYRRMHLHGIRMPGDWRARREATEAAPLPRHRFPLVRAWLTGFADAFRAALADGAEGLVIKPLDAEFDAGGWARCKP